MNCSNIFIPLLLFIGFINLLPPIISRCNYLFRNVLLTVTSGFFLVNVLILDWFFLNGVRSEFTLFSFEKYNISFNLEALGIIFLNLISVLWVCAILYTTNYLIINNIERSDRFLFFLNLCILAGIFIALAANLFTMFIGYEILTLTTVPLIVHKSNVKVSKKLYRYLKILMISSVFFFLPALVIIYSKLGNGDFIYGGIIENHFSRNQTIVIFFLFIFGTCKTAIYPLHRWLPTAMVASYPVSALLHAVIVVKAGLFCLFKIIIYIFGLDYLHRIFEGFNYALLLPIITILYSSIKALMTNNIKMVLAYSTMSNLSLSLLSAFMFTPKAMSAAIIHMVAHSFGKITLFYATGNYHSLKNTYLITDLYGLMKEMPKTSICLIISVLSLIGVPPLGGFISKLFIINAAIEQEQLIVLAILVLSTTLSVAYLFKILIFICKMRPLINGTTTTAKNQETIPFSMLLSLYLCTLGVISFIYIQQFINKFLKYL